MLLKAQNNYPENLHNQCCVLILHMSLTLWMSVWHDLLNRKL